jgi:hypothetical protein
MKKLNDYNIMYWTIEEDRRNLTVGERLSLDFEIKRFKKRKVLIIFEIDAYYSSFREVFNIKYEKFSSDFAEYVMSTLNPDIRRKGLGENIFTKINDDWYNTQWPQESEPEPEALAAVDEFVQLYKKPMGVPGVPSFYKKVCT